MALIICPECGAEVSEHAPACPSCGYPLIEENGHPAVRERTTRLGQPSRSPVIGTILIIIGVLAIFSGLFLIFMFGLFGIILGIIFIPFGTMIIVGGVRFCKMNAKCKCPYCGKTGSLVLTDKTYKCLSCKKESTVDIRRNCLRTSR